LVLGKLKTLALSAPPPMMSFLRYIKGKPKEQCGMVNGLPKDQQSGEAQRAAMEAEWEAQQAAEGSRKFAVSFPLGVV
jgi:uncharacterized protein YjbJ (UPF0337 family)